MRSPRLVFDFLKAKWYVYASGMAFTAAANVVYAQFPKTIGQFTDKLNDGILSLSSITDYGLFLLAIGVGYAALGGIGQYHVMYIGRVFEYETRQLLFDHFTRMTDSFYSKQGVGKLLNYFMNDVKGVRESISGGVNHTTNAIMLLLSSVYAMLTSSIPYYLILACIMPLLTIPFIVVKFGPVIRRRSMEVQQALGAMTEMAEEQFGGIRVTKKFAVESIMNRRFGREVDLVRDKQIRLVRISSFFQALIPFAGALSMSTAISFGGYLTLRGSITVGNFVALTLYIRMMITPLQQIGNVINTMQRSRASLERLNRLFAVKADVEEKEQAHDANFAQSALEIRNVSFAYPDAASLALQGIDLRLEPGRTLGIVGKTGSGKTTLVKLLLRVYDPSEGAITTGGVDMRELKLGSLRKGIAYVPQDGFLFNSTIRDNIAFYERKSRLDEVELAARLAQLYDDVREFPEQFNTKLGERGVTLSGGQRQRTSLARGLIKKAPVLILDDSFSAVDSITENRILDSIRKERDGKTNIIVSHRISAVKSADEIIVLDEGRIVQRGKHWELLSRKGLYAELHALQEEGSMNG
ncbi:ABC transporter ATP-binding protein [Cohnella herbarum]|uniref:ABC transporter ATP-binding protein n=1 Tax=Cohnella herbarum TaxID=2728023 RepID=A0A7Z2ZPE1_9BACL|nr:ABC transporter ATP-binding protein [Cohnella herbarum]QJD87278.1 ABC transporter ATP-binding protein [Cohnella herbarum]